MVNLGVVALDGTKIGAHASLDTDCTLAQLETEIARMLAGADATDAAEDERHGRSMPAGSGVQRVALLDVRGIDRRRR